MSYLLDTCVVSEMVKSRPNPKVIKWVRSCQEDDLFLSVIVVGEIQKGVSRLPESATKKQLEQWLESQLIHRFAGRIVTIDGHVARKWGEILAKCELSGKVISVIDAFVAASGLAHNLTVVTRNTDHMKQSGVSLHNPWQ